MFYQRYKVKIFELDLPVNRKSNWEKELNLWSLNNFIQNLTKNIVSKVDYFICVLLERCKKSVLLEWCKNSVLLERCKNTLKRDQVLTVQNVVNILESHVFKIGCFLNWHFRHVYDKRPIIYFKHETPDQNNLSLYSTKLKVHHELTYIYVFRWVIY